MHARQRIAGFDLRVNNNQSVAPIAGKHQSALQTSEKRQNLNKEKKNLISNIFHEWS